MSQSHRGACNKLGGMLLITAWLAACAAAQEDGSRQSAGADAPVAAADAGRESPAAPRPAQTGIQFIGRWLPPESAPTSTYAGSMVVLEFEHSSTVAADIIIKHSRGDQNLYVSVSVDGGKPVRRGFSRGEHAGVVLASGLSAGKHRVTVRKEGEPAFGAWQFANPRLDFEGRWMPLTDDRPIVEVIGDSDATGICALGPVSPAETVGIWYSNWAAESVSWVGLLEAELAAIGHPVDMVNLAISGSKTAGEAQSYDLIAPGLSNAPFIAYAPPGHAHASLVFLWGGGNDRHGGGDLAKPDRPGAPLRVENLSKFERGIFDQLQKIFMRNPAVRVVLLEYTDPAIPPWKPAYDQLESLLSDDERRRVFELKVYDPKGKQDACEIDPKGHPNVFLHAAWAGQILEWMLSDDRLQQLGLPTAADWEDS